MKLSKLGILIIVILLCSVLICTQFINSDNSVKVGNSYFSLPEGYYEGNLNKDGHINFTNGENSIFIAECIDNNLDNNLNEYINNIKEKNLTPIISNFTNDDIMFYKVYVENTNTTHYWFEYNGNVYTVYSWDKNNDLDDVVVEIIKSANSFNLF